MTGMRALSAVTCALLLAACNGEGDRTATHTVTDSVGVRIVESFEPAWDEGERWEIAPEPFLEIGAVEGEEPYLLDRVVGVARLDDGRIAIATAADNTIRFHDAEGRYLSRVGGSGDGPGEFSRLNALFRSPGRLYGRQLPPLPSHVYDAATGAFLGSISPPGEPDSRAVLQGVFGDGSRMYRADPSGPMPASGVFEESATLVRVVPEGPPDTLGVFPARAYVRDGPMVTAQQFGPDLELAIAADRFFTGHSGGGEVAERTLDGSVRTILRGAWRPRPVTDEDIERRKDEARAMGADEASVNAMVYPERHPAFAALRVDLAGNLWAQRPNPQRTRRAEVMGTPDDAPAPWDVFGPDGVWLGTVEQPARFEIEEIGEDWVAGVWVDEFGVEYVRIHEIVKPAG